jgi:hypothetical protein
MQSRDKKVLKLANKFLSILRAHPDRYEALSALDITKTLFVHPLIKERRG